AGPKTNSEPREPDEGTSWRGGTPAPSRRGTHRRDARAREGAAEGSDVLERLRGGGGARDQPEEVPEGRAALHPETHPGADPAVSRPRHPGDFPVELHRWVPPEPHAHGLTEPDGLGEAEGGSAQAEVLDAPLGLELAVAHAHRRRALDLVPLVRAEVVPAGHGRRLPRDFRDSSWLR